MMLSPDLANEGNANQRRHGRSCKLACGPSGVPCSVGVVVGVLNDEEHEQDKDDPSSTHHDDRGVHRSDSKIRYRTQQKCVSTFVYLECIFECIFYL